MSISCQNGDTRNLGDVKPRISEESNDKSKIWKLTEINEQSQCRSLKLPENVRVTKVCYLLKMYCISSHRNFIVKLRVQLYRSLWLDLVLSQTLVVHSDDFHYNYKGKAPLK